LFWGARVTGPGVMRLVLVLLMVRTGLWLGKGLGVFRCRLRLGVTGLAGVGGGV
jgi:hypothetical protein